MSYDNACKYLSEKYPTQFATWILGTTPPSVEVIKTELSIEPIRADYVTFLRTQERILHLEFEVDVEGEPPVPLRMLDYWVRLYRRDRVPITKTLILLKESASARRLTDTFQVENTQHHYRIIRLWEETPEAFLQNPALLPLASLCQTSSPNQLLGKVAEELAKIEPTTERNQIAACAEILAGLRFKKTLIKQLLREDIMRESVIYQDILQQGEKRALKRSVLDVLEARFGAAPPDVNSRLEVLKPEQLRGLLRVASICVTVDDFISHLT
ncbi:hypothetical protein BCD67_14740 [Oscillatoriales cyanobacterium USR001]|nr:hypothetical protein BCD67_14740 [Oscillatoriales cyanobacterium USR001]